MDIEITAQEFAEVVQQLYPTETKHVFAELKAAKFEQLYKESVNGEVEAVREESGTTGSNMSSSDS